MHYEKFSDGSITCIEDIIPFTLPNGWRWSRLSSLCSDIQYGVSNSAENSGSHRLLRITDIQDGKVEWDKVPFTTLQSPEQYRLVTGDIVFARTGATVGKSFLIKELPFDSVYASYLIRIRLIGKLSRDYVYDFFNSKCYWNQITDKSVGVGQPNCNGSSLKELLIPVPPINEQELIIKSIKNLQLYSNIIESQQTDLKSLLLKCKSKILDLAIRGKLVSQDPNDEPASKLLERIRHEKEELIKAGKLKRDKRESVIFRGEDNSYYETIGNKRACIDSEIHYDIPEGWTVERLKNLYSVNPKNDIANDETIVSFVPMNLINEQFLYNGTYELKQWKDCKKGFTHFADGDLGFAKISPCFENRKSVVFSNLKNGYGAGTTELYILRNFCEGLNPEYAILFLKSESFIERGVDTYSGTVGQQRIDKNIMMDTIIPIPPQNEQQRIADRVKQLFSILDSIQATIV